MFRPGENGMYWYVVVSGTLEMMHVDPRDEQKVQCVLVGDSVEGRQDWEMFYAYLC